MDRAKESVKKIIGKSGHHDTTIHETVAPAVTQETVEQRQHERSTTAIDKEIHQDHYHTTEQPVRHGEVLAEQHHHRELPVEHKSYEHDSPDVVKRGLEQEKAKYYDTSNRVEGEATRSAEPVVAGEHKHHHVHETIQPVVHKQTIEPHVVHTTVPVHEVHHNQAQHHSASTLPPVSMDEFKNKGGALQGREERRDHFPGEPRSFGNSATGAAGAGAVGAGALGSGRRGSSSSSSSSDGEGGRISRSKKRGLTGGTTGGTTGGGALGSRDNRYGTDGPIGSNTGYDSNTGPGGQQYNSSSGVNPATGSTNTAQKPSLMDKLNPKTDATGDGKAGFMK